MTTTNEKKNIDFRFRTKFKTFITEENQQNIIEAFGKFCSFPQEKAILFLWRITYSEILASVLFREIGFSEIISKENYMILRNELRFQYNKVYPDFLKIKLGKGVQEAQEQLERCNDPVMTYIVILACKKYLSNNPDNIDKTLHLLKSNLENYNFGGLRSLEFTDDEAKYLLPFSMQIHDLIEALWYSGNSSETQMNMEAEKKRDEKNVEVGFKALTAEAILANEAEFKEFSFTGDMNTLMKIGRLGFDLNEVVKKKKEIYNLLIAAADLESE